MKAEKKEVKEAQNGAKAGETLKNKEYEKELAKLHVELVSCNEAERVVSHLCGFTRWTEEG